MIYCVEDDKSIRDLILYALKNEGFEVMGFSDYDEFNKELENKKCELVLLDIMLPKVNGIDILKKLKSNSQYEDIPVIMLTAKNEEIDKIEGLNLGADDYITKPFSVLELIARIRAVLRRVSKDESKEEIIIDKLRIDLNAREVFIDNKKINLTYKEYELLNYLIKNEGNVLSRDKLMEVIWGFDFEGESRTVDVHIASLRNKLTGFSKNIETIRNIGYKWRKYEKTDN